MVETPSGSLIIFNETHNFLAGDRGAKLAQSDRIWAILVVPKALGQGIDCFEVAALGR